MIKWVGFVVFFAGAVGAAAMGFQSGQPLMETRPESMSVPAVSMRALPGVSGSVAVAAPAPTEEKKEKPVEVAAAAPVAAAPAPAAPAETDEMPALPANDKKPVEKAPPAAAAAAPVPDNAGAAAGKTIAAKPIEAPPALPPAPAPKPAAPKAPKPAAESADPGGAAPAGDGVLNLKASDTAEVVVDGRKIGPSPRLGFKVKAGKHKIRFDCYDAEGNTRAGKVQNVDVGADSEQDIDFDCPPVE